MLGTFLQVRRGETTRAALLFTYLFLVICSSVVTKATRDPLFQEKFGSEHLPYVDMASALSVAAVMGIYLRISRKTGARPVLIGTLLLSSAATIGFWFIARVREPVWMLPVLYVWASVAGVLLPAQVWTLANQVMTTREAKRLFGVVSGGAIMGWIVGGMVTRAIATRRGVADLLLPTALALAVCPLLVTSLWRLRRADVTQKRMHAQDRVRQSITLIWKSPHLRAVAILIGTSSLVTTIVGWQFKAVAKSFIPHTDELAAFYGTFAIYAGGLSLLIQLLLASRLLRRFGLGVVLLVVPVALSFGSVGLLIFGSLLAATTLKACDQVVRYSIDRSTVEMLYLPVPTHQMSRAKALIDTVVWRIGDGLGALLVLIAVTIFGLSARQVSGLTLVLLACWITAAVAATRHYVTSLRFSIYEHRLDAERLCSQAEDRSTTDVVISTLEAGTPDQIVYALDLLAQREPPMTDPVVNRLVGHSSPLVRRKAISLLASAEDASAMAQVEPMLRDTDNGVRAEALVYMARCGQVDPLTRVNELDPADSSAMASAIAHFLARPGPAQNLDAVRVLLQAATSDHAADRHQERLEAARLIGSLPDQFEDQLNALLSDPAPDVVRLALRAAAAVGKPSSVPLVLARLKDIELTSDAADTLVGFADRAVPTLRDALSDEHGPSSIRYAIPEVLQRIGTPEAEQLLVEHLLDIDPQLRLRSVSALNKLRQKIGNRSVESDLVETVLAAEILGHYRSYQLLGRLSETDAADQGGRAHIKESMNQELERIFRLMKLLLPQHDLHSAYFGLQSGNSLVHANSLEFLEHALPPRLRVLLLPLIDSEVGLAERIRIADRMLGATAETSEQALAAFAASDTMLRHAAQKAEQVLADTPEGKVI